VHNGLLTKADRLLTKVQAMTPGSHCERMCPIAKPSMEGTKDQDAHLNSIQHPLSDDERSILIRFVEQMEARRWQH